MSSNVLGIWAARIKGIRGDKGFITPTNPQSVTERYAVTERDLTLIKLGKLMVGFAPVVDRICKEKSVMAVKELRLFTATLAELADELESIDFNPSGTKELVCQYEVTAYDLTYEKLVLAMGEVAEALSAHDARSPASMWRELVDVLVRILDMFGTAGVGVDTILADVVNAWGNRKARHGLDKVG